MIILKRLKATNFKRLRAVDLIFPARGSILIEGHNEAGKSTLFEAVYVALYGEPLVGEESRAKLEEVIQHGQSRASVALTFLVGQQEFIIERIFEREKPQRAQLTIQRPDAPPEIISRIGAVNSRILQELHHLDGESLRNSCFVEQKELGRLETLSLREREEAIRKLLGLERLTRLSEQFKFGKAQQDTLALAERRLELAQAQEETRQKIAAEAVQAERLDAVQIVSALEQIADLEAQQAAAQEQLSAWKQQEQAAQARLQRCQAISEQLHACQQAGQYISDACREREAVNQAQDELARLERLERVDLPAARNYLAQVEQAAQAVAVTQATRQAAREAEEAVQAAWRKLDDLKQAEARVRSLETLRATMQRRKDEALRLKDDLLHSERDAQFARQQANHAAARDALEGWVRLKEVERRLAEYAAQRAGWQKEKQAADEALAAARSMARTPLLLASGLSLLTLLLLVAGFFWAPVFGLAALALIGSAVAWLWFAKARSAIRPRAHDVQVLAVRLQEIDVYRQAAIRTEGDFAVMSQHERQLQAVGFGIPPTLEAGRTLLEQLRAEVTPAQETHQLQQEAQEKRDRVIHLIEQMRQARKTTAEAHDVLYAEYAEWLPDKPEQRPGTLSVQAGPQDEAAAFVTETAAVLALAEQALLAAQQVAAAKRASNPAGELDIAQAQAAAAQAACRDQELAMQRFIHNLGLKTENDVGPERGRAGERVETLEQRLATRPDWQEKLTRHRAALTRILVETRDHLAGVVEAARQQGVELSHPLLSHLHQVESARLEENLLQAALSEITGTLQGALTELDEQRTQARLRETVHMQGTIKTKLEHLKQNEQKIKQAVDAILIRRHFQPPTAYTAACIGALWPLTKQVSSAEQAAIAMDYDLAKKRLFAAQQREQELAENLQAVGLQLDIGECEQQVNALREERAICQQATALIKDAYDRIARRILPITERNMQPLLRQLTGGRYHDVRLAPEKSDAQAEQLDYRIRIWDQAAGRYVAKNLFSGGTRDQCSLALRLAFALATLPQELGVAPGFIFLDEPLSAFDAQRAQALVELVTRGTIAAHFHQVVMISHHHAFNPAAFQYHVRMEDGQVVESDLPQHEMKLDTSGR